MGGDEDLLAAVSLPDSDQLVTLLHPQGTDAVIPQILQSISGRRFTVPFRVTMKRKRPSSSMDRVWIMAWIRSPCST